MNKDVNEIIEELKAAGASESEAEELGYFSKNLSNALNFQRSLATKRKFLDGIEAKNSSFQGNALFIHKPLFASILGALLLLGFATVVSAQDSLPGQPLYPVKRIMENVISTVNPSFNSEILKRRSVEIKQLSDPANNTNATDNNSQNVQDAIKDYENELNEHEDVDSETIEESKTNLEEAKQNSTDGNRQEIEDVLQKTKTKQEEVRNKDITPVPTSPGIKIKDGESESREDSPANSTDH